MYSQVTLYGRITPTTVSLFANLGGCWNGGSGCGFTLSGNSASGDRGRGVGGRLLYVPQTKVA